MSGPLLLLDGASMWFRSFFGVPSSITAPDGRPVNAVRGFIDSLATLISVHQPSRLIVCLDMDWRPQFRVDAIPSYKAHRVGTGGTGTEISTGTEIGTDTNADNEDVDSTGDDVPDELSPQVAMISELLEAIGITTAGAAGYEADDVIATLAAAERHDRVIIVSGDRDLLQLVADDPVEVRVLYLGRGGMAAAPLLGPHEVADRYGIPAHRAGAAYAELALLRGDPSDGLPGVAGIGEKTAGKMLTAYQSLENILAAAQDKDSALPQAFRTKILAATDYINAAQPVVQLVRNAAVQLSTVADALPLDATKSPQVTELAHTYGVSSSIRRLSTALEALSR